MTDAATTPTATTPAPADTDAAQDATPPDPATTDTDTTADDTDDTETTEAEAPPASREAARYRKRLRAVEAERDQLAARLDHLQRGEAERLAAAVLADGGDLWRDGHNITELINDDGHLDPDKVAELASNLVAAHPHWSKRTAPKTVKTGGMASGATSPAQQITPSWSSVLRGTR